ncbi:transposase, IS605 OrfB family [mine drainage metagenome]|uniref:Transposase, IS605 OrfB family n=1 Tax=mine drainage metagenome TaxID=410659 RepID=T0ZR40_9ZZZZ
MELDQIRTAVCPVTLTGADYRRTHDACHQAALLWDQAVDWVHAEWKTGGNPGKYEIQSFLTSIPQEERPLHAHTTEILAHDLYEAIKTSRTNRKNGMKVRASWRKKNYRPLSFTKDYGWRISGGKLHLSLGRGRPRIDLPIPALSDSATGEPVSPELWGEIQLCWDQDARRFSLRIPYQTKRTGSVGDAVTAIDEGVINSMALATWVSEKAIEVTIVNGREARAVKRQRNKSVGSIQKKLSHCKNGSRKHRRLVATKKKVKARAKAQLRDFNHQVSRKAASHVIAHGAGRLVIGDVRGIEKKTRQRRSANRHQRQRLSQWERGVQERHLGVKTGLELEHLNESDSTKTCPACGARNRPSGRDYRCKACSFACHRDAVGAINILQKALYGDYVPIRPDTEIRVTYLRAVERWSPDQRTAHRKVQRRKVRALSIAPNRASTVTTRECKPTQANPSTSSSEPGPLAVVA